MLLLVHQKEIRKKNKSLIDIYKKYAQRHKVWQFLIFYICIIKSKHAEP